MALLKLKELPSGVTFSYHRIIKIHIDFEMNQTLVDVASYVNIEARQSGKPAGETSCYIFPELITKEYSGPLIITCYESLCNLPEFIDAESI